MKITSDIALQLEPALAVMGGKKAQASSLGVAGKNPSLVPNDKPSVDATKKVDAEALKEEARKLNEKMDIMNKSIQFSIDDKTKDIVVKVVDKSSGEVISQFPPEDLLKLRERMNDMAGLLIKETI
jgi:flagellar protein FlaG